LRRGRREARRRLLRRDRRFAAACMMPGLRRDRRLRDRRLPVATTVIRPWRLRRIPAVPGAGRLRRLPFLLLRLRPRFARIAARRPLKLYAIDDFLRSGFSKREETCLRGRPGFTTARCVTPPGFGAMPGERSYERAAFSVVFR
jgi:hypothetical protein